MSEKRLKSAEERLLELYVKEYLTETQFYEMVQRIKASSENENK